MNGEYAIRAMIHLAGVEEGQIVHIQDISKEWAIPEKFLRKIIPKLSRNGLIITARGQGGGITLAHDAETITPLNVIEAVEGETIIHRCFYSDGWCHNTSWCAMHSLWMEVQSKMKEVLNSKSIKELAEKSKQARNSLSFLKETVNQ